MLNLKLIFLRVGALGIEPGAGGCYPLRNSRITPLKVQRIDRLFLSIIIGLDIELGAGGVLSVAEFTDNTPESSAD